MWNQAKLIWTCKLGPAFKSIVPHDGGKDRYFVPRIHTQNDPFVNW